MRKVEFRGLPVKGYADRNWRYGNAVLDYDQKIAYIDTPGGNLTQVEWETVGQFTGEKGKIERYGYNIRGIFEGDVIEYAKHVPGVVEFKEGSYWITNSKGQSKPLFSNKRFILGNIHQHSHLLEDAT